MQALFVPMALAVGFAMVTSYLLSSTFVPVLSVWLMRLHQPQETAGSWFSFARLRDAYAWALGGAVAVRWVLVPVYLIGACLLVWLAGDALGQEIFPNVDTGQFQLRVRAATGTRIEVTEQLAVQSLDAIKQTVGPDNVAISVGYVGLIPSSYPINAIYLWTSGPEEAVLRVALKSGSGVRIDELKEKLRRDLPRALEGWLRTPVSVELLSLEEIDQRVRGLRLSFEPADIVNEVMSFGSPTPVEVAISGLAFTGKKKAEHFAYVERVRAELAKIESLRDLQFVQPLDYPTVEVKVDRALAGDSGVTTGGRGELVGNLHLLQPLRRPQFLGRSEHGHRLPGASRDSDFADELAA